MNVYSAYAKNLSFYYFAYTQIVTMALLQINA